MKRIFIVALSMSILSGLSQSNGGVISSNTTVCSGTNNGILSVGGYSGSIVRWEYSYSAFGPWTPIVFTATSYNYVNLMQSTYFRVVVQLGGYAEANSNTVLVSCDAPTLPGIVSSPTLQCINSVVSATLSASNGNVISWDYSTNNWISTNTLSTTNTLVATLSSLTSTTQIRALVRNGVCPALYSNTVTINPAANSAGGTITGVQTLCSGTNTGTLTLSNHVGSIQQWENSLSSGGPFNSISGSSGMNSITLTNLSLNSWFRVSVKNANCSAATSATNAVTVHALSNAGTISGSQNVCAIVNTGTLLLTGNTGLVSQWEFSSNGGTTWNSLSNTTTAHAFSNLNATRIFRAIVQNGICPPSVSAPFTVNVNALPSPTFNISNNCVQAITQFTNLTSGSNSYLWSFGDGGNGNVFAPSHVYNNPGTFTVKLNATSSQGCNDSLTKSISIFPRPIANFVSADTACFGTPILFVNSSNIASGNVSSLKFDFKDGSPVSNLGTISHAFLNDGNHQVVLVATSNFGCRDSIFKNIIIHPKPNAAFKSSNVCKGQATPITNMSTISSGYINCLWNFGNSGTSTLSIPNYTFPIAGSYTVSLLTASNHNCKDTAFVPIVVNERPVISFSASSACFGSPSVFNSTLTPSMSGFTSTLHFGDGTSSSNPNSMHVFPFPGIFVSTLTVVSDSGCINSKVYTALVHSRPISDFRFENACPGDSVLFTNTSSITNGNLKYLWSIGSIASSTIQSPTLLIPSAGAYSIQLLAISDQNCIDTSTKVLTIFDAPTADFTFTNSCDGFPLSFSNTSTSGAGLISGFSWDFGDHSGANVIHPQKLYLNEGSYTVTLIAVSKNKCSDTVSKIVKVDEGPIAHFGFQNSCVNTISTFTNTSQFESGSYDSFWDFGDGMFSSSFSPLHTYSRPGSYSVHLKINSSEGCSDSLKRIIDVYALPEISAGPDTIMDKGLGIRLIASGGSTYAWYPGDGLDDPTSARPFANPDSKTIYYLLGKDEHGCINFDTVEVDVRDQYLVFPFNVLTPDENGKNDTWIIKNIEAYPENEVVIFDQWNQKVFEAESYHNEWSGKNSKGDLLPDATYYYLLSFKTSSKKYSGYITLMRNR